MSNEDPIQLEPSSTPLEPVSDKRPRMPEPLPVRLIAVADVVLPAQIGLEPQLDDFYVTLLGFVRESSTRNLIYLADNLRLCLQLLPPPIPHDSYRPAQIEVQCLADIEHKLIDQELEYTRQRGLVPGSESLIVYDPCGNLVEISEFRRVM